MISLVKKSCDQSKLGKNNMDGGNIYEEILLLKIRIIGTIFANIKSIITYGKANIKQI